MSTLKDKFENYEKQPDEKVWQSIMETMNNRVSTVRRRRIALVTSTAVVASIVLLFAVNRSNGDGDVTQTKTVAQQRVERTATVRSEVATIEDVKTVATVDRPLVKDAKTPSIASESQVEAVMPVEYASGFAQGTEVKTLESVKPNNSSATSKETGVSTQESTGLTEVNADVVENNRETVPQRPIEPRKIADQELVIWIPNAFSPDDPVNDEVRQFKVKPNTDASLLSYEIFIYSRSGRLVYHSKDVSRGWDGTYNGYKQPMGTYVYIIELNDANKGLQHKKGTITLIR